jgi:hypothetical protein
MSKYIINKDELINHLKDQINFLIASAISYDNGFEGEAKRLATVIRVLVHDTTNSNALLTQLNKMNILFYDSAAPFHPDNLIPSNSLTMNRLSINAGGNAEANYIAPLEYLSPARNKDKKVGFNRWWNCNIVIKDNKGNLFPRKKLVLTIADKEGGAHVDPKLDQAYANLTRFNSLAWKVYTKGEIKDMGNPVPPSIRQIAHEVLKTLKEGVLDLFIDKTSILGQFDIYEKHCQQLSIQRGLVKEASHVPSTG